MSSFLYDVMGGTVDEPDWATMRRVRIAREGYGRFALTPSGLVPGLTFPILGTRMPAMAASK